VLLLLLPALLQAASRVTATAPARVALVKDPRNIFPKKKIFWLQSISGDSFLSLVAVLVGSALRPPAPPALGVSR
jgi:hypothetical protein